MGDVYKARDKRLDRIVALKHSKSEFTARFEREARTAGAFNRKYICQLYDVGPNFLVMEPIDGVPLKGPLPVEKAVVYAGQILEALDAAHRKGDTIGDRLDTIGSYIPADAENIRALARIAEIHERRLEAIEGDQPQRSPSRRRDAANFAAGSGDCLAQDPDERFQNALDMKRDLLWAVENSGTTRGSARGSAPLKLGRPAVSISIRYRPGPASQAYTDSSRGCNE